MPDLEPCPFCRAKLNATDKERCCLCILVLQWIHSRTEQEARQRWNTRPIESALRDRLDEAAEWITKLIGDIEHTGFAMTFESNIREAQQFIKEVKGV